MGKSCTTDERRILTTEYTENTEREFLPRKGEFSPPASLEETTERVRDFSAEKNAKKWIVQRRRV